MALDTFIHSTEPLLCAARCGDIMVNYTDILALGELTFQALRSVSEE